MSQDPNKYLQFSPFYVDDAQMSEANKETLYKKIALLSDSLREILISSQTSLFIESLVSQGTISETQGEAISRVIRDIALGTFFIDDLKYLIKENLVVDDANAEVVAKAIEQGILIKYRAEILRSNQEKYKYRMNQPAKSTSQKAPLNFNAQATQQSIQKNSIMAKDGENADNNVVNLRKKQ